ncbi:winged helix-turn-helix transcriptional regulator [Candidatus Bipolaricaulota bacterium]|nr:winged helix-turn-helix transcriptional regulator [Candidatus Bipolaricaulota bacterium]
MKEPKQDPRNLTLGQLLLQVCRLTGDRLRVKMEEIGLHKGQGFILFHLWHHDGIAQNVIAHALHVSAATVTSMLQRMERDGWITRERDSEDQRIVRVHITEKAKAMREEAREAFRDLEKEVTSVLTKEERKTLQELLEKLHGHLTPEGDPHRHPPFHGGQCHGHRRKDET